MPATQAPPVHHNAYMVTHDGGRTFTFECHQCNATCDPMGHGDAQALRFAHEDAVDAVVAAWWFGS